MNGAFEHLIGIDPNASIAARERSDARLLAWDKESADRIISGKLEMQVEPRASIVFFIKERGYYLDEKFKPHRIGGF